MSGGAELITGFNIELPPAWRNTECTASLEVAEGQLRTEVDLRVTGTRPLTGDRPRSTQFGGCGVRGQGVDLPFKILTDNVEIKSEKLSESLLEVTRWRFGVFSESGVIADPMYPLNGSEAGNQGCSRAEAGLCPLDSEYNKFALTKQNLLCGGLSARRSILNHFTSKDGEKFVKPQMRFVMPLDTKRVILILDQSTSMADTWKSVLASTFQFINSLREGTELAIVSFAAESATVHLRPTRVEGGNREGLHYRIPRRLPQPGPAEDETAKMKSCLDCAIEQAARLATNTTSIVSLLSSYVYFDSKNNGKLMEFEQSANPILHWLVFGSRPGPPPRHQHIHNNVFLINEHQNTRVSGLNISSQLNTALAATINDFPSRKFHHELLPMMDQEGSFSVESSLSSDLWLQLLTEDTTEINVFEIKSPSGQIFSFPKFDAGLVYFSLRGPRETGVWSYKVKLYPGHHQAGAERSLILECWATGSQSQVELSAWTIVPEASPEISRGQPVVIFAKLEQAGVPVSGAELVAVVTDSESQTGHEVRLVDNGSGYPDITAGDGVYSGYFTQFSAEPGLYSVTITAINNSTASVINTKKLENVTIELGGSRLPTEPSVPLESFRRFVTAASFYISQGSEFYISSTSLQRRDVFPPVRITDFRLANLFNNSLFVTLTWSAPGDDLSLGTAFRYEIRCFTKQEALSQENFGEQGIMIHTSLVPSPEPAGTEQRCTVGVPWPNEVFYYAIVAFDAAGNRGEVSNIIPVFVKEPMTTTAAPSTVKFSDMKDVSATLPLKSFIQSEGLMYIIAGIISLILIIIVIILTIIIRRLGGCTRKTDPSTSLSSVQDSSSPSLPDLCTEQSYVRNSVSYISGYDLPEMLEYALDSPHKSGPQHENYGARRVAASDQSQYLGMDTSHSLRYPRDPAPPLSPLARVDLSNYTVVRTSVTKPAPSTHKYNTAVTRIYSTATGTTDTLASEDAASPSVSPVNSNYTGGQSTDCSVSVSGSDHELISDSLQVVSLPPHLEVSSEAGPPSLQQAQAVQTSSRPEPRPRKIPPAVPSKTVHASLV